MTPTKPKETLLSKKACAGLLLAIVFTTPPLAADDDERIIRRLGDGVPQAEEWVPEEMDFSDLESIEEDSDQRAAVALQAEQDGLLLGENGAFALWLSILNQQPDNTEAREGLARVAERMRQRVIEAFIDADAERLSQLDFDYSRFSDVPVIATLREQIAQLIDALAARPDLSEPMTPDALERALADNTDLRQRYPTVEWLESDRDDLTQALREAVQSAFADGALAALDQWLSIADSNGLELDRRPAMDQAVQQHRWSEQQQRINNHLANGELAEANALLDQWPDQSSGWLALKRRADFLETLQDAQIGDRISLGETDNDLLPVMRYVGQFNGSALLVAETEVTVAQFRRFVDASGYVSKTERDGKSTILNRRNGEMRDVSNASWQKDFAGRTAENDHPVIHISWGDSIAYIDWIRQQSGWDLRLPTAPEATYFSGGGQDRLFWWGDGVPDSAVENLAGEGDTISGGSRQTIGHPISFAGYSDGHFGPAPVASFVANPFGLHDTLGNVAEWTLDCADGSDACTQGQITGGHWGSAPADTTMTSVRRLAKNQASATVGFRLVLAL